MTTTKFATYLYSDPEGVRFTFNSSGNLTGEATYNAYGNVTSGGVSSITPFGYAGGYTDPTGLIYLIHRYYDPVTGQFTSVDPLVAISGQPYVYAGGDPVNGSDPLGLGWYDIFNPFSPNNPFRENAENGGLPSRLVQQLDPAYLAISHGYNTYELTQNPCSSNWSIAWQATQAAFYAALTVGIAYGTGQVVGFIENPDAYANIGDRWFYLHWDETPHDNMGSHLQLNWWQKGVSGSGGVWRVPWPPWG